MQAACETGLDMPCRGRVKVGVILGSNLGKIQSEDPEVKLNLAACCGKSGTSVGFVGDATSGQPRHSQC